MPLREKAKNLFRTKSNSLSQTTTNESATEGRHPSNVYKPGEPMPRPKYRAIPKPEHKAKLEAFNFGDAWRKRSFQSTHSPMGTRAPSRRASLFSNIEKKTRRESHSEDTASDSQNGSVTTSGETDKTSVSNFQSGVAKDKVDEQQGDDDVANVGLSKTEPTNGHHTQLQKTESNQLHKTMSTATDHHPFSQRDLELAMRRSNLQVSAQS